MSLKKGNMHPAIKAVLIGGLITLVVAIIVQVGAFTSADIRFTRQSYGDSACPSVLFPSGFEIFFSDVGNRGTDVYFGLRSPDNISFTKGNDSVNLPAGQSTSLRFSINDSSLQHNQYGSNYNVTIIVDATYKTYFWSPTKTTNSCICRYKEGGNLEKGC